MKVPKIRFKGFEGDWEERKLGDLCTWISEKYWNRNDLEVFSVNNKTGFILQTEHFDNNEIASKDKSNYKIVTKKQFAYNPSRINVWSIAYLKNEDAVIVSPLYNIFECKKELNEMFLERFMKTFLFNKQRILNTEVSVRECLSFEGYCKIKIIKPETKEQEKIWSLFEQIDSHISKNQQKLEKLKNMKQFFLQKLFPKDWSALPELRFKGFEGAWEERKLGELAEWFEYWLNAPATTFDWNNKYIRITDIDETSNLFLQTDITSPNCNLIQADKYKLSYWDILFARTWASVWKSYMYLNSDGLVYYAWFLIKASVKEKKNTKFIFLNTLTEKYKKYIKITSQRSWQPWVNAIEYSLYKFMTTSVPEQEKIWAFFEKLDTQITQQTQKLEKLKNIKQSLLEKMFI